MNELLELLFEVYLILSFYGFLKNNFVILTMIILVLITTLVLILKKGERKMTELETIKLSRDFWKELYEKFPIKKSESSYWEQIKKFEGYCPCCDFYEYCDDCPLKGCTNDFDLNVWTNCIYSRDYNAIHDSPLFIEAKQAAKNIFEKLDEKYKELKEKENDRI
jgi:hypothetical protein